MVKFIHIIEDNDRDGSSYGLPDEGLHKSEVLDMGEEYWS